MLRHTNRLYFASVMCVSLSRSPGSNIDIATTIKLTIIDELDISGARILTQMLNATRNIVMQIKMTAAAYMGTSRLIDNFDPGKLIAFRVPRVLGAGI